MKKNLTVILALTVLAISLTSCGQSAGGTGRSETAAETSDQSETAGNKFDEYAQNGYTHGSPVTIGDGSGNVLQVYFNSEDLTDCVLVEASLTDEECSELDSLDFFDENYDADQWSIILAIPGDAVTVTSLNDRIPSEEEVNQYVGKTVGDLMGEGYEWITDKEDEDGSHVMIFHSYDTHINYAVVLEGDSSAASEGEDPDMEELSDEMIGEQVIAAIRFDGFDD